MNSLVARAQSSALEVIESAKSLSELRSELEKEDVILQLDEVAKARELLWAKYLVDADADHQRLQQHREKALRNGDKVMRYGMEIKGEAGENGYPLYIALHGGGGAPPEVNDQQWEAMKRYYLNSIENGIYIAPRGVTDTWNLHFVSESYALYAQIIANMIAYEGADPNRVYLLGYSAGGDGVYQISPRLADRLAAANMSAGHHNGISPINLQHVPFYLQVGELDSAYDRHRETVKFGMKMDDLSRNWPKDYWHTVYVHADKSHSYVEDRQGAEHISKVLGNPTEWLDSPAKRQVTRSQTDAVTHLSEHKRRAWPERLYWSAGEQSPDGWHYWLRMAQPNEKPNGLVEVERRPDLLRLRQWSGDVECLLHEEFFDFSGKITVWAGEHEYIRVKPKLSLRTMLRTLEERRDPAFCVPVHFRIKFVEDEILVEQVD